MAVNDNSGIVPSDVEIEEKFADVSRRIIRAELLPPGKEYLKLHGDKPCYPCGGHNESVFRHIPFDEFISRVVEELEFGIYMMI